MCDVSIVIPFKNEEENLKILLPKLIKNTQNLSLKYEIILVDDHSTDNSYRYSNNYALNYNNLTVIQNTKSLKGQTGAFKNAFNICNGSYILRMDADLQDNPDDLYKFEEKINEKIDLIIGLRENRSHKKILRIASQSYDLLISLLFDTNLYSHSGSYICFKKSFVENLPWYKNDHRYLPLIVINRGAVNTKQIFVQSNKRVYGKSKYKTFHKIFFGLFEVIKVVIFLKLGFYRR